MPRKTKELLIDEITTSKATKKVKKVSKTVSLDLNKKTVVSKKKPTKKPTTKAKSAVKVNKDYLTQYYDLPYNYNKTIVKILAQTPKTLFVYWEISDEDKLNYIKNFGEDFFQKTKPVLTITNKTNNYSFEVEINDFANSWYFNVEDEACEYSVILGRRPIYDLNINNIPNNYLKIASSNEIESPNGHILFEEASKTIYFKNVKTQDFYSKDIANLQFMKRIAKPYNLSNLYKNIYKDENIFDINNPTSN